MIDDSASGQPVAPPRLSGLTRVLAIAVLCCAGSQAFAQAAPQATVPQPGATQPALPPLALPETATPASPAAAAPSMRDKATQAAAATLTALLPRLAASDTMPMLDRSAVLAGDLSRLMSKYAPATPGAAPANAPQLGKIRSVLDSAVALIGTPYRWGGTTPEGGFDCSGLVSYVFRNALGIELPRVSQDMAANAGAPLVASAQELRQGDLVFFGHKGRVDHVGIYVGEGRFLHSPSTGKDVRVDTLLTGYWANKFMQARRVAM